MIWILFTLLAHANSTDWTDQALRLTGESDRVREAALKKLEKLPDLKTTLKQALDKPDSREQALALDVIVALSLDEFVADLFSRTASDTDGRFHLALNGLIHSGNRLKIAKHYQELLKTPAPLVVRVIALDTLSRLEVNLTREELTSYLKDPAYEIRSAAISYLRALLRRFPRKEDVPLFAIPLGDKPYQLRLQTIQAIKDLPSSLEVDGLFLLENCREDVHPEVRKACGGQK